jgi:hypothetical protein
LSENEKRKMLMSAKKRGRCLFKEAVLCKVAICPAGLQRSGIIYGDGGKSTVLPRGMPLVTRMIASSEQAWNPMASSSAKFCLKTRTVPSLG